MTGETPLVRLTRILDGIDSIAVAVSGGVDSLTLASIAASRARAELAMFHAVSAAVPPDDTRRVQSLAQRHGWPLRIIAPGELGRADYVANPVDRCLHCKRALYTTIRSFTQAQIVSGTNLDDLGDYRPGLHAARESDVRHPFVEAGIDKSTVRVLARDFGLGPIAELPASPCLASRVETGLRISAATLHRIDAVERMLREATGARTVRCRVRHTGLEVELDHAAMASLGPSDLRTLGVRVNETFGLEAAAAPAGFVPYRMGSAFLRKAHD